MLIKCVALQPYKMHDTVYNTNGQFLPREAMLSAVYAVVVCLCAVSYTHLTLPTILRV